MQYQQGVLQVNYFVILRLYHRTLHGLEILMLPFVHIPAFLKTKVHY